MYKVHVVRKEVFEITFETTSRAITSILSLFLSSKIDYMALIRLIEDRLCSPIWNLQYRTIDFRTD